MSDNGYVLNDKQREIWYNQVIVPMFLEGKKSSEKPTFVLLTGQPGAGKTTAAIKYSQMLNPEPVRFGGDDIRILLPYADKLLRENPAEYPFISKADMSWAREKLVSDCIDNKFNIQIDSILSNPNDWKMGTLLKVKDAGYRIECTALGVHRYISEVSMFSRREEQIKNFGVGFPVTMDTHDKAYEILPAVVAKMYKEGVADKVSIYNRIFENFYDTDKVENPSEEGIIGGIIKSRESYLSKESLNYIDLSWKNVKDKMVARNAAESEMNEMLGYYIAFRKNSGMYLVESQHAALIMMNKNKSTGR